MGKKVINKNTQVTNKVSLSWFKFVRLSVFTRDVGVGRNEIDRLCKNGYLTKYRFGDSSTVWLDKDEILSAFKQCGKLQIEDNANDTEIGF